MTNNKYHCPSCILYQV